MTNYVVLQVVLKEKLITGCQGIPSAHDHHFFFRKQGISGR